MLGRMYFRVNDDDQNFLLFAPMFSFLITDRNGKVTSWISNGISFEKIKLFGNDLEPITSNLANGKVNLKFSNFSLLQKSLSSLYSNF